MVQTFKPNKNIDLESGKQLEDVTIAYHTYGEYIKGVTPVIWVCHALTANSDVADWWSNIFGANKILDPQKYFIVCANILGSSYGSHAPNSMDETTQKKHGNSFPDLSVRDLVTGHIALKNHLQIDEIFLLIGGSLGGQQCMEWAITQPTAIKYMVLLATNAKHSPWGIAFNETQRMALECGAGGLQVARAIAMLSYRNYQMYDRTKRDSDLPGNFGAASYQRYQGQKLASRFDADCYHLLTKVMDSHDVGRGRNNIVDALKKIKAKTLIIGIATDMLFPIQEQQFLRNHIEGSVLEIVASPYGHDGFLTEGEKINRLVTHFIKNNSCNI